MDFSPSDLNDAVSLKSLRDSIINKIETSTEALSEFVLHFNEKTEKADSQQLISSYILDTESVYRVTENFPKIYLANIPSAIISDSIKYSLDVSGLDEFQLEDTLKDLIDEC